MQENILAVPIFIKDESLSILAHIVVFQCRIRRIIVIVSSPCITDIQIDRVTISVQLPHSRNRNLIPCCIVIAKAIKIQRAHINAFIPVEFPHAVQRQVQSASIKCCRHRKAVSLHNLRILPVWHFCSSHSYGRYAQQKQAKHSCQYSFHGSQFICH